MTELLTLSRDAVHTPSSCPLCGAPESPRMLVAHIQATVAAYYNMPVSEMYSARRCWDYAHPRQVAMYLSRELTPKSLPDIGRRFGNRDHTTILYACRKVAQRIRDDREVGLDVEVLKERLAPAA